MNTHRNVLIVDYGVGNHQSVANALAYLGYPFSLSRSITDILAADAYILPGVGAFGEAMQNLKKLDLVSPLAEQVLGRKKPLLGICLGMQVLSSDSEENGFHEGLGWVEGHVCKLTVDSQLRVPHVGWNTLEVIKRNPLFLKTQEENSFYFDHSYHLTCAQEFVAAFCGYGGDFVAAINKENIFGVQFHPEKSQVAGLKLFRSFFNHVFSKTDKG